MERGLPLIRGAATRLFMLECMRLPAPEAPWFLFLAGSFKAIPTAGCIDRIGPIDWPLAGLLHLVWLYHLHKLRRRRHPQARLGSDLRRLASEPTAQAARTACQLIGGRATRRIPEGGRHHSCSASKTSGNPTRFEGRRLLRWSPCR